MQIKLESLSLAEVLHFLGWRGTPLEDALVADVKQIMQWIIEQIAPAVSVRRFRMKADGKLEGTTFRPMGNDVQAMLTGCDEALLLAATLGVQSERILLQQQAKDASRALIVDAVLSAAIEAVCDEAERSWQKWLAEEGKYLTDRFSPGYGDMPIAQSREICDVLSASHRIGLTVSQSGILIPRKSVTAIMGISTRQPAKRCTGCDGCSASATCPLRRNER